MEKNNIRSLTVQHSGSKYNVEITQHTTLNDLKTTLENLSGVPKEGQKLIAPRNSLAGLDEDAKIFGILEESKISKITLIGTSVLGKEKFDAELQAGLKLSSKIRLKDDLDFDKFKKQRKQLSRKAKLDLREKGIGMPKYTFGEIRVLQEFSDKQHAEDILRILANDPGVLKVLEKYQWNIPVLSEMYPEGKVGISAVCVLGLNVNKGQEIKLRIRTDDLKGFRKMTMIKEVLCHELSHNRFSEHDENFYKFMREIQHEVENLNWKNGKNFVLGGPERYVSDSDSEEEEKGFRLGGSDEAYKNLSLKDKVRLAAEKRIRNEASNNTTTPSIENPSSHQIDRIKSGPESNSDVDREEYMFIEDCIETVITKNSNIVAREGLESVLKYVWNVLNDSAPELSEQVQKPFDHGFINIIGVETLMSSLGFKVEENHSSSQLIFIGKDYEKLAYVKRKIEERLEVL